MCDCKKEMEAKLLETVQAQRPEAQQLKVELDGYGFMLTGNELSHRPVMPIKIEYMHILKNGNVKKKKETISFALKHCPFCGEEVVRTAA